MAKQGERQAAAKEPTAELQLQAIDLAPPETVSSVLILADRMWWSQSLFGHALDAIGGNLTQAGPHNMLEDALRIATLQ